MNPVDSITKIALFIPTLETAGAERITVLLANGLAQRGYKVDVVLVQAKGDFLADLGNDVQVVDLKCATYPAAIPRLASYIRKERPAVVISALDYVNAAAILAGWLSRTGTPVVAAVHTSRARRRSARRALAVCCSGFASTGFTATPSRSSAFPTPWRTTWFVSQASTGGAFASFTTRSYTRAYRSLPASPSSIRGSCHAETRTRRHPRTRGEDLRGCCWPRGVLRRKRTFPRCCGP